MITAGISIDRNMLSGVKPFSVATWHYFKIVPANGCRDGRRG
jgi:hypothetical protein